MADKVLLFPELPIVEWEPSKETFHRYLQLIGKIRALIPTQPCYVCILVAAANQVL